MAGRIPQTFIDDLLSRSDIVELINSRVPLKKKGKEYTACCPFHNEKTPSFTVSETKQFYHCFGCGAHGTALGFLMEFDHLDFVDAIEALAAEHHIDVPRESDTGTAVAKHSDDKLQYYDILKTASDYFQQELKTSDKAVQYLKKRGLTGEIAARYKIGYAPDQWQFLTDKFNDKQIPALIATGLVVEKDNKKQYDRFRDRVIYPIHDQRGRTIGFGGRIIDQGEPKYLNSPENVVFHKGLELYGMYEAKQSVRKLERIVIVEGYMDVVALAQHGINYVVATLGTATTKEQIQKTLRTVQEVIFCYDGDAAGLKAAWRALENSLSIIKDGHIIKFLFLPEKEDPDSLIRTEGKEAFEKRLDHATTLSDFLFDRLKQKSNIETEDGKASFTRAAKPLLASINECVFKDLLYNKLSTIVGISVQQLQKHIETPTEDKQAYTSKPVRKNRQIQKNSIRTAIALLLQHPELSAVITIPSEYALCSKEGYPLLHRLHTCAISLSTPSSAVLLERFRDSSDINILLKLMEWEIPGVDDEQQRSEVYGDAITHMNKQLQEQTSSNRLAELESKSKTGKLSDEEKKEYNSLISIR